jgi:hypothetical protein
MIQNAKLQTFIDGFQIYWVDWTLQHHPVISHMQDPRYQASSLVTSASYCELKATGLKAREHELKVSGPNITGPKPNDSFWYFTAGDQYVY